MSNLRSMIENGHADMYASGNKPRHYAEDVAAGGPGSGRYPKGSRKDYTREAGKHSKYADKAVGYIGDASYRIRHRANMYPEKEYDANKFSKNMKRFQDKFTKHSYVFDAHERGSIISKKDFDRQKTKAENDRKQLRTFALSLKDPQERKVAISAYKRINRFK